MHAICIQGPICVTHSASHRCMIMAWTCRAYPRPDISKKVRKRRDQCSVSLQTSSVQVQVASQKHALCSVQSHSTPFSLDASHPQAAFDMLYYAKIRLLKLAHRCMLIIFLYILLTELVRRKHRNHPTARPVPPKCGLQHPVPPRRFYVPTRHPVPRPRIYGTHTTRWPCRRRMRSV